MTISIEHADYVRAMTIDGCALRFVVVDSISASYFAEAPPLLVIIDKDGIVRKVEVGAGDFDVLEADLLQRVK